MTTADLAVLLTLFLGLLTFAGYVARVWPADAPFGDWAEEDRRWDD